MKRRALAPWRGREATTSPWQMMSQMQRQMKQIMDEWNMPSLWDEDVSGDLFSPPAELKETDKEYIMKFEVPGIKKEDINIEVNKNRITVSGERKEEKEEKDSKRHFSESFYGAFTRSFALPEEINEKDVDAAYKEGVLTVKIPKTEQTKSKKIEVH